MLLGCYWVDWVAVRSGCIDVLSASVSSSVTVVDNNNNNTSILCVSCSGPCTPPWYWFDCKIQYVIEVNEIIV